MRLPFWFLFEALSWSSRLGTTSDPAPPPDRTLHLSRPASSSLTFNLRHVHAQSANSSHVLFADVRPQAHWSLQSLDQSEFTYSLDAEPILTYRPSSPAAFHAARFGSHLSQTPINLWEPDNVLAPNTSSRHTLHTLAKMTSNAYTNPSESDWYPLPSPFNSTNGTAPPPIPFGWEPDADGFRGHIFASEDNTTVVISIKGTSAGWIIGGGGPTVSKDKLNDNILFSCCCARVGPTWSTVCGCYRGSGKCDQRCLETSIAKESLFYNVGVNLYNNVTYLYPNANIWIVGHSLGGSLASLLGSTFGAPVVAFEAPGERLAARRLHLPESPSNNHITHVLHTADPLAMGTCTGVSSVCGIAGYAMESHCHMGNIRRYDTITNLNWTSDIRTHGIKVIVERLLADDWSTLVGDNGAQEVPEFDNDDDCVDCYNWEFGDFN